MQGEILMTGKVGGYGLGLSSGCPEEGILIMISDSIFDRRGGGFSILSSQGDTQGFL